MYRFTAASFLTLLLLWTSSSSSSSLVHAEEDNDNDGEEFDLFVAHNDTMTCTPNEDAVAHDTPTIHGVNIGGWMVLEPWITPSLFYQFLGGSSNTTGLDMYTFCEVLGPDEGNRQLRRHWESWVTKDIVRKLKEDGQVNALRLPVGDWMYKPYGPYIGCTDGSLEYVDRFLEWAAEYDLPVLFDVHGVIGSQNGFDNSGMSGGTEWTTDTWPERFQHWPTRKAEWMGTFDIHTNEYTSINRENIDRTLDALVNLVFRYKDHPSIFGLAPLNEPWEHTPIGLLKRYYWDGYLIVKELAPDWNYVIHDSFRFDVNLWGGFLKGCPDKILDTHIYQAWSDPSDKIDFYVDACHWQSALSEMELAFGPVVVGEWSLATDNCAMWLNGFNDNLFGFPKLPCKYVPCGESYLGSDQPGVPLTDRSPQGPFGTGISTPSYGYCPVDRDWIKGGVSKHVDFSKSPSPALDETNVVMTKLAQKKIHVYTTAAHGFFFWNFRTDLYEPQWSYMLAVERGWIKPTIDYYVENNDDNTTTTTTTDYHACVKEDETGYTCVAVRGSPIQELINGILWVDNERNTTSDETEDLENRTYEEILTLSDEYYDSWYHEHKDCGFGDTARLIDPDEKPALLNQRTKLWLAVGGGFLVLCVIFVLGGNVRESRLNKVGALSKDWKEDYQSIGY